jgi:DNA-binding PadR family transcriptional regulator
MIIPIRHQKLSLNEKNILDALNKEHLTSIQILNRIESISLILHVYTLLDDLSSKGYITSYVKKDVKYHHAS